MASSNDFAPTSSGQSLSRTLERSGTRVGFHTKLRFIGAAKLNLQELIEIKNLSAANPPRDERRGSLIPRDRRLDSLLEHPDWCTTFAAEKEDDLESFVQEVRRFLSLLSVGGEASSGAFSMTRPLLQGW